MSERTKGEWKVGGDAKTGLWIQPLDPAASVICDIVPRGYSKMCESEDEANADFIVRAVNAHDVMLAALKAVEWSGEEYDYKVHSRQPSCLFCECFLADGHASDCYLDAAIRLAEGK